MSEKSIESKVVEIESSLKSSVSSFSAQLKAKHLEDPNEYPLDNGALINDMFVQFVIEGDF